jgi:hypothetical protein
VFRERVLAPLKDVSTFARKDAEHRDVDSRLDVPMDVQERARGERQRRRRRMTREREANVGWTRRRAVPFRWSPRIPVRRCRPAVSGNVPEFLVTPDLLATDGLDEIAELDRVCLYAICPSDRGG